MRRRRKMRLTSGILGTIFSGSAVVDWHNTAGFGEEAMVAIFTHDASGRQMQSIAFVGDFDGETFTSENSKDTSTWRGALTIPRDLSLTETAAGARLRQQPVAALHSLRGEAWSWENETITPETTGLLAGVGGAALELSAEFRAASVAEQDLPQFLGNRKWRQTRRSNLAAKITTQTWRDIS